MKTSAVIQDDISFFKSEYMRLFQDLKQGRNNLDHFLEVGPNIFHPLFDMWCNAVLQEIDTRNPGITYLSGGSPIDFFSITFNNSELQTQTTLAVSLKK